MKLSKCGIASIAAAILVGLMLPAMAQAGDRGFRYGGHSHWSGGGGWGHRSSGSFFGFSIGFSNRDFGFRSYRDNCGPRYYATYRPVYVRPAPVVVYQQPCYVAPPPVVYYRPAPTVYYDSGAPYTSCAPSYCYPSSRVSVSVGYSYRR